MKRKGFGISIFRIYYENRTQDVENTGLKIDCAPADFICYLRRSVESLKDKYHAIVADSKKEEIQEK